MARDYGESDSDRKGTRGMKTAKTIIRAHDGNAEREASFSHAFALLRRGGGMVLKTSMGTPFTARAADSRKGPVIRFFQGEIEYARAYECCWIHYYNCNRTRIGMYCDVLDLAASGKGA